MKKSTYTLHIEYDNGDKFTQGGLTQTRCYQILSRYEDRGWVAANAARDPYPLYVVSWKIDSGWQKT